MLQHLVDNLLYAAAGALLVGYCSYRINARRRYLRKVVAIVGSNPDEYKFINILDGWVQSGELRALPKTA